MQTNLTEAQIRWAAQHDWFSRRIGAGFIEVTERWVTDGVVYESLRIWDGTFRELRDWAGY